MAVRLAGFHNVLFPNYITYQVEYIALPVDAVNTHRERPSSPTHRRLRVSSETARELSDTTATTLRLAEGDRVVKTIGGPHF